MNQKANKKIGNQKVAVMLLERMKEEIEKTKERIVFRLVDREVFGEEFDNLVSVDTGNGFALVFAVDFEDCYMYINKELAISLELYEEEIYELSMVNTPRMHPATFQGMATLMLKQMVDNTGAPILDDLTEVERSEGLYVLSNKASCNGAASIYYPGVKKKIAELLDSEYYVLPCSRHEVIIAPYDASSPVDEIKKMVKEINRTCISTDDLLSDTVLKYDRERDVLVKA